MKKKLVLCLLLAAVCLWMAHGFAESAGSDFVISGDVLVKYQGSTSSVNVPDGVRVIGGGAFAGNKNIVTVVLPSSVKEIEGGAFQNCSNLQYVITGGNLSVIGSYAFDGCPKLNDSFRYDVAHVSDTAFGKITAAEEPEDSTPETPVGGEGASHPVSTGKPTSDDPAGEQDTPPAGTGDHQRPAPAAGSLKIVIQPFIVQAAMGDEVEFTVLAVGSADIRYQWMQSSDGETWHKIESNSAAFHHADTETLSFTLKETTANRKYRCFITDGVNNLFSDTVFVRLGQEPAQPVTPPSQSAYDDSDEYVAAPVISAWLIGADSAKILWTPVMYATAYELYRSENGGEPLLLRTLTETSCVDDSLDFSAVKTYGYSVTARLSVPGMPDLTQTRLSKEARVEAFAPPTGISIWQKTATSVEIVWEPVNRATSYEVYRSENGGDFHLLVSVTGFSYTDQGLDFSQNTYSYRIRAVLHRQNDGIYIESAFSDTVEAEETITAIDVQELARDGLVYTITPEGAVVTAYQGNATSLTIPSTIRNGNREYTVIGIGPGVFRYNKTLISIKLPNTIKYIETAAFAYCSAFVDQ